MKKLKEYRTKKNKIIVFDFDGVLADTIKIKGDVFYDTFSKYGKKIQKYARKFHLRNIGLSREYKFNEILNFSTKQNNKKILKEINLNFFHQQKV